MRPLFAVADVQEPLGEAGYLGSLAAGLIEGRSPMLIPGPSTRGPLWPAPASLGGSRRLLLLVALLVGLASLSAPAVGHAAQDAYVATDVLYLRAEPGTDGAVLAEMYDGEYVAVIDGPSEHGWYYVDYAGINGWAHGKYLSISGSGGWAGGSEVGASTGTAWVGTDALNVRAAPSRDAEVIDTLAQGAELALAGGPEAGFYPILAGGVVGWVWGEYVAWEAVAAGPERWLDVDRSSGTVRMMIGDEPIATYVASMGFDDSDDGFYATALGSYRVYEKVGGLSWTPYGQAYIKYWVGFDPSRLNGFHSYSLDEDGRRIRGGDGPTGGCIATDPQSAKEIYAFAAEGMRVEVHW